MRGSAGVSTTARSRRPGTSRSPPPLFPVLTGQVSSPPRTKRTRLVLDFADVAEKHEAHSRRAVSRKPDLPNFCSSPFLPNRNERKRKPAHRISSMRGSKTFSCCAVAPTKTCSEPLTEREAASPCTFGSCSFVNYVYIFCAAYVCTRLSNTPPPSLSLSLCLITKTSSSAEVTSYVATVGCAVGVTVGWGGGGDVKNIWEEPRPSWCGFKTTRRVRLVRGEGRGVSD